LAEPVERDRVVHRVAVDITVDDVGGAGVQARVERRRARQPVVRELPCMKVASEMASLTDASSLRGHSDTQIMKRVFRRAGEVVKPTK